VNTPTFIRTRLLVTTNSDVCRRTRAPISKRSVIATGIQANGFHFPASAIHVSGIATIRPNSSGGKNTFQ
jgi:hypothetical protein